MKQKKPFVLWFDEISLKDTAFVGGKNAALGEMYQALTQKGVNVPYGFAITVYAYRYFLEQARLMHQIKAILKTLDVKNLKSLRKVSEGIRELIERSPLPPALESAILKAHEKLKAKEGEGIQIAVRSSATAEDLPGASFAGQQETFLNIDNSRELIRAVKKCMSSLWTQRAISYREDKGFRHEKVYLSVGVQVMVRSDLASSGVIFTIDTESGFDKVVIINGAWGLGEIVVQGKVIPDEFVVFKPTLEKGYHALIDKKLGKKTKKIIYNRKGGVKMMSVSPREQGMFVLKDKEALQLAKWAVAIEDHFSSKYRRLDSTRGKRGKQPMDIEWAKDGKSRKLYVVQARPETVHSIKDQRVLETHQLTGKGKVLITGQAIGMKIASGKARVLNSAKEIGKFKAGEVLVTTMTDPDWEPIMKIAAAIVTDKGGRTSHAAIVSRELGIPAIVGTLTGTKVLKNRQMVTVDCSTGEGRIFEGTIGFQVKKFVLSETPKTRTKLMINIGNPEEAFGLANLPHRGVGLAREEFILASYIKVHPLALLNTKTLPPPLKEKVKAITAGFKSPKEFFIQKLAFGIARIAAAFHPYEVIVRLSDFKTNEYRGLLGGELYEPEEENPMIGWRGASRYYDPKYEKAFLIEVEAIRRAREEIGLTNIVPMVPFCRTLEEGKKTIEVMKKGKLAQGKNGLKIYAMCEIPSNVMLAEDFLKIFDGFSIGSNDLTQLVLGLDRDSNIIAHIGNELHPAVKKSIAHVIVIARKMKKYIGICGQGPSDYPEFAEFLVKEGIESISINPDTLIKTLLHVAKLEKRMKR